MDLKKTDKIRLKNKDLMDIVKETQKTPITSGTKGYLVDLAWFF